MVMTMNLWSLTLLPGEAVPMYVRRDFQITNAALAEELASETGRSVIKVRHHPIPEMDDDDSEFDSDEDMDEDEDDEEEDDEEIEEALKAAAAAKGDDDDESEADSDDFSDDESFDVSETAVICSLTPGKCEHANLNLTFVAGEIFVFEVTGENAVHLTGNYIWQGDDSDDESDDEHDDYSDLGDEFDLEELEEEFADEEVFPKGKITEVPEPKAIKAKAEKKAEAPAAAPKRKAEEIESPAKEETLTKKQKKALAKKQREEAAAAPAAAPAAEKKESKKRTLPSGLIIEDVKTGTGPVAKPGKRLGMRYIGKLENGKQFDANTGGKPFSFVLGRGEVIAGWDQGLAGMAVGGERRLTIPAKLAYGKERIPGIPPNSTLKFEVKLVSVN